MAEINITEALTLLGEEIHNRGMLIKITIGGEACINLGENANKGTGDVDAIDYEKHDTLFECVDVVAEKLRYSHKWPNIHAESFSYAIPFGWEGRVREVFSHKGLIVYGLSRSDLIASKIKAQLDRGFDLEDLILLNITKEEFKTACTEIEESMDDLNECNRFDLREIYNELFDE